MKIDIKLTPAAIAHIKRVIADKDNAAGFRLSMRKYGCNGYGYVPEVINKLHSGDIELPLTGEFRFFVDPAYVKDLQGTVIDYVEKSLGQFQMMFNNPNAEGECGCGESVNLKSRDNE